jgi:hypothetical protein
LLLFVCLPLLIRTKETVNKNLKGLRWHNLSYYRNKRIAFPLTEIASEIYRGRASSFLLLCTLENAYSCERYTTKKRKKASEPKASLGNSCGLRSVYDIRVSALGGLTYRSERTTLVRPSVIGSNFNFSRFDKYKKKGAKICKKIREFAQSENLQKSNS